MRMASTRSAAVRPEAFCAFSSDVKESMVLAALDMKEKPPPEEDEDEEELKLNDENDDWMEPDENLELEITSFVAVQPSHLQVFLPPLMLYFRFLQKEGHLSFSSLQHP